MKNTANLARTLTTIILLLLFCFAGAAFGAKAGNNPPVVGASEKLIGPNLQGTLLVGWRETSTGLGTVEAYLTIGGKAYVKTMECDYNEYLFNSTISPEVSAEEVTTYSLPDQIVEDQNMDLSCRAVIFSTHDVSNLGIQDFTPETDCTNCVEDGIPIYKHIMHCDVKVSFICPK